MMKQERGKAKLKDLLSNKLINIRNNKETLKTINDNESSEIMKQDKIYKEKLKTNIYYNIESLYSYIKSDIKNRYNIDDIEYIKFDKLYGIFDYVYYKFFLFFFLLFIIIKCFNIIIINIYFW